MAAGMDPNDVYRYHTRYIPTITIMNHSEVLERTGKHDPNFESRAHDSKIIDDDIPRESAQLLLLDLNILPKNYKEHRIVIISSPYKRCLETATVVAQEVGVPNIHVYYDFGEAVSASRDAGWDFAYEPLTVPKYEMNSIVDEKSQEGVLHHNDIKINIASYLGKELSAEDVQENDVRYNYRIGQALNQAVGSLEADGDHVIIIAHGSTIKSSSKHFIPTLNVLNENSPCGYVTFCSPSDDSVWLAGRRKIQVKPVPTEDSSKKIGHQLDNPFGDHDD
jgi:broad specificity phosphatase PhoE